LGVGQPLNAKSVYYFEVWDLFTRPSTVAYISSSMDEEIYIRNEGLRVAGRGLSLHTGLH